MKILPNLFPYIKFTSNYKYDNLEENGAIHNYSLNDDYSFDYDAQVRDAIRAHMYSRIFPYVGKDEYKSSSYTTSLSEMCIPNLQKIGDNCYRGSSLVYNMDAIPILKKSGVYTVIDLAGKHSLEVDCKKAGVSYFDYNVDSFYWSNPMFRRDEDLLAEKRENLSKLGLTKTEMEMELEDYKLDIDIARRQFMRKFFELVSEINYGSFYICCDCGEYRTPNILALNTFFNPRWRGVKTYPTNDFIYDKIRVMYENLSEKDKFRLCITNNYDKKLKTELGLE